MHGRAVGRSGGLNALICLAVLTVGPPDRQSASSVLLATTTSTRDTGLLDSLLPLFERISGFHVRVIAVGSGQALEMGKRGDADVVLSHAPDEERALFAAGYFTSRRPVMRNDFILVGPAADPAALRGQSSIVAAFERLSQTGSSFVSRGDRSGTHQKELDIRRRAGVGVDRGQRYSEAGQGMAPTLQIADQRRAYTLTDRATYLVWRSKISLVPVVEDDSLLANVYHVLEVSGTTSPRVNRAGARALAEFFVSAEARALIGGFGRAQFGRPLFIPDSM